MLNDAKRSHYLGMQLKMLPLHTVATPPLTLQVKTMIPSGQRQLSQCNKLADVKLMP